MIGFLRGVLFERSGGEVTIDVAGVGYRVTVSAGTANSLGELGDEVFVYVHHHYREDDQTLYGFGSRDERICFEALISAHGVGPALALAILTVHQPVELAEVLAAGDVAALCMVPGVGKKTAARLLVELKEKLEPQNIDLGGAPGTGRTRTPSGMADVREALSGLGYGAEEIQLALRDMPSSGDTAVLLRDALQRLAVGP